MNFSFRMVEYTDHLHEHFHNPCVIKNGCYMPPQVKKNNVMFTGVTLFLLEIVKQIHE